MRTSSGFDRLPAVALDGHGGVPEDELPVGRPDLAGVGSHEGRRAPGERPRPTGLRAGEEGPRLRLGGRAGGRRPGEEEVEEEAAGRQQQEGGD